MQQFWHCLADLIGGPDCSAAAFSPSVVCFSVSGSQISPSTLSPDDGPSIFRCWSGRLSVRAFLPGDANFCTAPRMCPSTDKSLVIRASFQKSLGLVLCTNTSPTSLLEVTSAQLQKYTLATCSRSHSRVYWNLVKCSQPRRYSSSGSV